MANTNSWIGFIEEILSPLVSIGFIIKLRTEMNIVKIAFIFPKGKSRCVNNTNSSWIFENVFSNEKMACTFAILVGGECGPDARSRNRSCEIVPLVSCNKSILSHKKLLKFSGCKTEVELILARSACFQTPANIQKMTICPLHRARLGIGWRRSVRLCSVPKKLSGHSEDSKRNADRGLSLSQSQLIMEATGEFFPVGSGKPINLYL